VAEHTPVLRDEVLAGLAIRPGGRYCDATFGRGGHAAAILGALGPGGRVVAIDRDPDAIRAGSRRFAGEARLTLVRGPFGPLEERVRPRDGRPPVPTREVLPPLLDEEVQEEDLLDLESTARPLERLVRVGVMHLAIRLLPRGHVERPQQGVRKILANVAGALLERRHHDLPHRVASFRSGPAGAGPSEDYRRSSPLAQTALG
jgi:hypothetical protein